MGIWAIVVIALVLLLLAAVVLQVFWVRRLSEEMHYAELLEVATPDGSAIELRRLSPPPTPTLPPVLLVHGVAANHRNVDVAEELSLARHLNRAGRDVWLLTLRSARRPRSRTEKRRMGFDDMVNHDLPTGIAEILERTRAPQVDYVGFSMGGMLLYAALARTVSVDHVRRAVTVGSPGRLVLPWAWLRVFRGFPAWLVPALWLRLGARTLAFCIEWVVTPFHRLVYNPRNVESGAVSRALVNLIEDVPGPLQRDLFRWALHDGVLRLDGAAVLEGLRDVRCPAAFFAGAVDRIAPPAAVSEAREAWGSRAGADTQMHVLGKGSGAAHDYGHGDLAVGRHLVEDLFEPIERFLDP